MSTTSIFLVLIFEKKLDQDLCRDFFCTTFSIRSAAFLTATTGLEHKRRKVCAEGGEKGRKHHYAERHHNKLPQFTVLPTLVN